LKYTVAGETRSPGRDNKIATSREKQMHKQLSLLAAAALAVVGTGAAAATVTIPGDHVFPESMTQTGDGTLFFSSIGEGAIFVAPPGAATAKYFVKPNSHLRSVTGVLADEKSNTLYACTNDWSMFGITTPGGKGPPAIRAFNLKTGADKGTYVFPGNVGFCNDIAVGKDGAAYVTDSIVPRVLRLRPGAKMLEVWVLNPIFGTKGINLDGIAFGADGNCYVTGFTDNKLFKIEVENGMKAGQVTELAPIDNVVNPDGFRPLTGGMGNEFLLAEGGHISLVTIDGPQFTSRVLANAPGSVSVGQHGKTGWVLEGQLNYIFDPKLKGQKPGPFIAQSVALP
jgi:sugar lactone lactonase YvrE